MQARPSRVVGVAAVALEVGLVSVDRLLARDRPIVVARLPAAEAARDLNGLPIAEDGGRRGRLEVVGEPDLLEPLGAAVGDADGRRSGSGVAAQAEMDARRDLDVMGLLPRREPRAAAGGFELARARLGHGFTGSGVRASVPNSGVRYQKAVQGR
jgi:hypothetical protein